MKLWFQFNDGQAPEYGHGTDQEAAEYLRRLNALRGADHYEMTALGDHETPPEKSHRYVMADELKKLP